MNPPLADNRPDVQTAPPGLWDRIGIFLSGACVVHCLFLPVVLAMLPLWPVGEQLHAWLHPVFAVLLIPTTLMAMVSAYRKHGQLRILVLLGCGLAVILLAGILGHAVPGEWTETSVTLLGSGLLITGHWKNWRAGAACSVDAFPHNHVFSSVHHNGLTPDATAQLHSGRRHRKPARETGRHVL